MFLVEFSTKPATGALAPVLSEIARQAAAVLVPAFQMLGAVFAAMALIFLTDAWLWRALGIAIAAALLLRAALLARRAARRQGARDYPVDLARRGQI